MPKPALFTKRWAVILGLGVLTISVLLPLMKPGEREEATANDPSLSLELISSRLLRRKDAEEEAPSSSDGDGDDRGLDLEYDFYRRTCPAAEEIVRTTMATIYSQHPDVSAALLRLLFHDCFIKGCDASVLLDDSRGNRSHPIERVAVPNRTLKGFDNIDMIKRELENHCPGIVSCADTLVLATREGIVLAGGPFYPLLTGRRDSSASFFAEAMAEIPRPDDNVSRTLQLFSLRGFDEKETVALLGGHNIGKIGCEFILARLHNFMGTGQPDPTISSDFLSEIGRNCGDIQISSNSSGGSPNLMLAKSGSLTKSILGLTYYPKLATSISSGTGFDTHYYQSLLIGRGLLHADQQLMADERTARLVRAYASDDGTTFRLDFARAMMKMSSLGVLSGSIGQIRKNCSLIPDTA